MHNYKNTTWLLAQVKSGKRLQTIASECNVSIYTISKYYNEAINNLNVDQAITFVNNCKNPTQVLSPKSKPYKEIVKQTSFLPSDSQIRERMWYVEHNTSKPPICKECTNHVKWDYSTQSFRKYCSVKCGSISDVTANKRKQTNLKNRNVCFPSQSLIVRKKYKNTMLTRYGTTYPNLQHITPESMLVLHDKHEFQQLYNKLKTTFRVADYLGVSQSLVSKRGADLGVITNKQSGIEEEIVEFIRSICKTPIEQNTRKIIPPQELDIYLPEKKIAIEINGVYWHSENNGKDKTYHILKTTQCEQQNIRLIHIFDIEWLTSTDLVKSRLANILAVTTNKIYARKCIVKSISKQEANSFFSTNHIQKNRSAPINIGLFFNNEIVSCMSFGIPRFNKKYQYELIRFASKINTNVVGGATKIFSFFKKTYDPLSVISYSDVRWNTGRGYELLGFKFIHRSKPNYWYIHNQYKPHELQSRLQFQKHKLKNKLNAFNPLLSEWKNMKNNGYDRVWDCGNDVWAWKKDPMMPQTECLVEKVALN